MSQRLLLVSKNTSEMYESSVHSVQEAGWCCETSSVMIQPHIFGEKQLDTATVTVQSYRDTLETFLAADSRRLCTRNVWFNKVTTCHISTGSVHILRNIFSKAIHFSIRRFFLASPNSRHEGH
jgi:hypothetical protein